MKVLLIVFAVLCSTQLSSARFLTYDGQVEPRLDIRACIDTTINGIKDTGNAINGFAQWIDNVVDTVESLKAEKQRCDSMSNSGLISKTKKAVCNLKFTGSVMVKTGSLVSGLLGLADEARDIAVEFGNGMMRCFGQENGAQCYMMTNNYYEYFLIDN